MRVMKTTPQDGDALLAHAQELRELLEQRLKRHEQGLVLLDFVIEIELAVITLATGHAGPRLRAASQQPIEIHERHRPEALGKTRPRQAYELTERAHTHGGQ